MPLDFADQAQSLTEQHISNSISKRKTLTLPYSGKCLACGDPVEERRFCDSDCREDHEASLRRKHATYGSRTI